MQLLMLITVLDSPDSHMAPPVAPAVLPSIVQLVMEMLTKLVSASAPPEPCVPTTWARTPQTPPLTSEAPLLSWQYPLAGSARMPQPHTRGRGRQHSTHGLKLRVDAQPTCEVHLATISRMCETDHFAITGRSETTLPLSSAATDDAQLLGSGRPLPSVTHRIVDESVRLDVERIVLIGGTAAGNNHGSPGVGCIIIRGISAWAGSCQKDPGERHNSCNCICHHAQRREGPSQKMPSMRWQPDASNAAKAGRHALAELESKRLLTMVRLGGEDA